MKITTRLNRLFHSSHSIFSLELNGMLPRATWSRASGHMIMRPGPHCRVPRGTAKDCVVIHSRAVISDSFLYNLFVQDDHIHPLHFNPLPYMFHHIGFAGKILVKLFTILKLHDEQGTYHLSLLIKYAAGTGDVPFHPFHVFKMTGTDFHPFG